jgi:SAM-dependent methyltransferase
MDRAVYRRMAEQEERHWWFSGRRKVLESLLKRYLPAAAEPRLLEVGCGTGGNLALLQRFGRVDAAEYDPEARAAAVRKSGLAIRVCALPDRLDAADGHYDFVVLLDVLEHVADDVGSLRLLKGKLRPGGRLLVTVPALPWLWSAHDVHHHHFRRYTRATLNSAAERAGLCIVRSGYFSTLLLPLIVVARLVKKAFGNESADDEMPGRLLNGTLRPLFGLEGRLVGRVKFPIGSSLYLVAERAAYPADELQPPRSAVAGSP